MQILKKSKKKIKNNKFSKIQLNIKKMMQVKNNPRNKNSEILIHFEHWKEMSGKKLRFIGLNTVHNYG